MGLGRAARGAVGRRRPPARRLAAVLGKVPGRASPSPRTSPISSRRWTRCCVASAATPGAGASIAWRPWSTRRPASSRRSFVPVAKHYGVSVVACPPRRGNRKGSVEKSIHFATQRFWRTMTRRDMTEAQAQLDRFCRTHRRSPAAAVRQARRAHRQRRGRMRFWPSGAGAGRPSADLAEFEGLRPLPAACYPATIEDHNKVGPSGLVAFEGNAYSVPPGLIGAEVVVRHRLGTNGDRDRLAAGILLASHYRETPGGGYVVRDPVHQAALEHQVLAAFTTDPPCRRKANRPPGEAARDEAAKLLAGFEDDEVVVSLAAYQSLVDDMADAASPSRHERGLGLSAAAWNLAYLRLAAAAEALPGELDHAREAQARALGVLRTPARGGGGGHRGPPAREPRALRPPARSLAHRGLRLRRPAERWTRPW